MTKPIRAAIAASAIWLIGVLSVVGAEFLSILPSECVAHSDDWSRFSSIDMYFLSCNAFTDIPTQWWGVSVIRWDDQIIQLSVQRLLFVLVGPIAISWIAGLGSLLAWRWIARGR